MKSILRIRSSIISYIYHYMQENDYTNVSTPIITSSDCEGAGDIFTIKAPNDNHEVKFFGQDAYLTVSGQLHLESMVG